MNSRRRLLFYLLLNVLVSALVTGGIILIYDLAHKDDCANCLAAGTDSPGSGTAQIRIVSINGAGSLDDEQVILVNEGSQPLILKDWYLKDSRGTIFTFPQVTLHPEGEVIIHTKTGSDDLPDLYWNRSSPVWQAGELAGLYDPQNIARAFYRVP